MVELQHYNGIHVKGVIDYKGFGACPNFDNNNDNSVCTVCFDVGDVPAGEYTYVWSWIFNENNPPYTSCWEATVAASEEGAASPPVSNAAPVVTPVVTPVAAPVSDAPPGPVATPVATPDPQPDSQMCTCPCAHNGSVANADACVGSWQQCGGRQAYSGGTQCCSVKEKCVVVNSYYHQCQPQS
jgi:Fungal cellulose binding domain